MRRHSRYVRARDAHGHRMRLWFAPIDGVGVGLYRQYWLREAELLLVLPGLQGGLARHQIREAALAARPWPDTDIDE